MNHLLVTNDFPPKIGGIQSYLYELWRRLPAGGTTVLTTAHEGAAAFDAAQGFRIVRTPETFLFPSPALIGRIDALAAEVDADLVLLDPVWPLGAVGPQLARPYGVIVHGAELTVPARLPFLQLAVRAALRRAEVVIAAGGYPAEEARRAAGRTVPTVVIPPGVDTGRFAPLDAGARTAARTALGVDPDAVVLLCVSRLVPRKGIDVLLQAVARVADEEPRLTLLVAGAGRDRPRLEALAGALSAPARFLGAVSDEELPALYGAADAFAMICRDRWLGLEQEGFGIVFLEAAAAGVASVAGRSGGSAEAVDDGRTGFVVDDPTSVEEVEDALHRLLLEPGRAAALGAAARERAERDFAYDRLAPRLLDAIRAAVPPAPVATPADEPPASPVTADVVPSFAPPAREPAPAPAPETAGGPAGEPGGGAVATGDAGEAPA